MIAMLAASAALSFAPPLDRPLRYETTERRPRPDGTVRGATLTQEVVFTTDGDGYVMTIRTTGYRSAMPADESDAFDAAMKPMVGVVVRLHLSHGGVPERVIDGAASWSAMLAALRTQIVGYPAGSPAIGPASAALAALSATPPAMRDACLLADADDLLGMRLPPLAVGAAVPETDGTITRESDVGGDARFHERKTNAAAGRTIETDADVAVSLTTGVVIHSLRRTSVAGTRPVLLSESEVTLLT